MPKETNNGVSGGSLTIVEAEVVNRAFFALKDLPSDVLKELRHKHESELTHFNMEPWIGVAFDKAAKKKKK